MALTWFLMTKTIWLKWMIKNLKSHEKNEWTPSRMGSIFFPELLRPGRRYWELFPVDLRRFKR